MTSKNQPSDQPSASQSTPLHVEDRSKQQFKSMLLFLAFAVVAGLGYFSGVYHNQIIAALAPVFGQQAYSADIDLSSVEEAYRALAANYDGTLDKRLLVQGASRGLVAAAGDAYTVYMNNEESSDFGDSLTGNIGGGIGAEIGIKNEQISIIRTLNGNPAIKAGLKADDIILSVNDESTEGWTVAQAVNVIRGEEGTTVKLEVKRGDEVKEYNVTRAIISNPSVESEVEDGVGIITITRFDGETGTLARAAAQDLKKQNVKGIILDLRGNGGGYLSAAKDVASLWLGDDKVVVTERVDGKVKETITASGDPLLKGIPTVVVVDGGTASASEIVAGALKDYKVASIVGEATFGKGSVQRLVPLDSGGQLKVTIARWYTPNGKNLTTGGILPDKAVELTQADLDAGIDTQINKAKETLGL